MSRIITAAEFKARLVEVLRHYVGCFGSVTGPGRSGAIASVYASHLLGIPWLPCVRRVVPSTLQPTLIIDTAVMSGATLRKAQQRILGPSETLALFVEPPRLRFWYEAEARRPHLSEETPPPPNASPDDGVAQSHVCFHAKDSPEANGRLPQAGDVRYDLSFTLADGRTLVVYVGQTGLDAFKTMLREMAVDEALDEALGDVS